MATKDEPLPATMVSPVSGDVIVSGSGSSFVAITHFS
jgi:hypothetical protein